MRSRTGVTLPLLVAALVTALLALPALAEAQPLRRLGQNPRSLALGGTGVSYANDEMALYYNPAGLGAVDSWWVEALPIAIEASDAALDLVSGGEVGSFENPSDLIRDNIGKEIQLRALFYPTGVFNVAPGWTLGIGYFQEIQAELMIRNQATPEIDAFYREDKGYAVGLSAPSGERKFLWGVSRRSVTRRTGEGTISSADLALASARGELDLEEALDIVEGSGAGYDVGLLWRIESLPRLRAQFGATIQNVGDTELGLAGTLPQEISLGWTIRPEGLPFLPVMMALEFRDVTRELSDDDSIGKRTHFGLEVGLFPTDNATSVFTFRAGYSAGKPSYGVEIAFGHNFSVQYVVHYQEYGPAATQDARKRQLLQINLMGF